LWCSSHPDYSSHEKRKEALAETTQYLNGFEQSPNTFTEEDIRNQFKNLKDMYRRKMKRMEQLKAMNHPIEEPTWFYFQRLKFLDSSRANEVESPTSFEPKTELDHSIDDLINSGFPSFDKQDKNQPSTSAESVSTERSISIEKSTGSSKPTVRRGTKRSAELPIPEMHASTMQTNSSSDQPVAAPTVAPTSSAQATVTVQQALSAIHVPQSVAIRSNVGNTNDTSDDLECWGRFVVSTVRKLASHSPAVAVEVKKRINDILYEVELRGLTDATRSSENNSSKNT
uniref:MADF domain-containing protein n=1 Tax=Acrobeloides nanus TaxID=290746 RepID=A0A914DF63_9BILA